MFNIKSIRTKIIKGEYRLSEHAVKRMIQRGINREDIKNVILTGDVIEQYPKDKYSPSCLIYGKTRSDRELHVLVSFPPKVIIITIYEPDPKEWINGRIRRL
ncbi:DUF4258 domain-containing protein [Candidatus Magnetomoraceae bacterium gMMP-15]